jgi:dienelactone hydrolase
MAELLVLHHALGRTDGVAAFAERLRTAGHEVHLPDLYEGRTFATIEEGVAHAEEVGFDRIVDRGLRAADGLPTDLVYVGFSLGVLPAERLAQTRSGARGALLFHSCVPPEEFGTGWPEDVPVQIHAMESDPWFVDDGDLEAARALVAATSQAELFLYPGDQHLFTDASLDAYDEDATALVLRRVLAFLADR